MCAHLEPDALVASVRPPPTSLSDMHLAHDIETLMMQSRWWRKELSYDGGVRSTLGEPAHWYCGYSRRQIRTGDADYRTSHTASRRHNGPRSQPKVESELR